MMDWIKQKLIQKRDREQYNVIRLRWQKAELEKKLQQAKQREK